MGRDAMFDPTIFDNLKVVTEGAVYDLDLRGEIVVTGRSDSIELSAMSRSYSVSFRLVQPGGAEAEIRLSAGTEDLAGEILELAEPKPGCRLDLVFYMQTDNPDRDCPRLGTKLNEIWGDDVEITQLLTWAYAKEQEGYVNEIRVDFGRKFGEEVAGDVARLLEHMVLTLREVSRTVREESGP